MPTIIDDRQAIRSKPWKNGDYHKLENGYNYRVLGGLYMYEGSGWGVYYSTDGNAYKCSRETARILNIEDGCNWSFWDIFIGAK